MARVALQARELAARALETVAGQLVRAPVAPVMAPEPDQALEAAQAPEHSLASPFRVKGEAALRPTPLL